jgi:glutamine cyclotransferase
MRTACAALSVAAALAACVDTGEEQVGRRATTPTTGAADDPAPAGADDPAPARADNAASVGADDPDSGPGAVETPVDGYRVVATYPHDPRAFTQGLLFADGGLYESTGKYGASGLRFVELESGRVLREKRLASGLFGEGLTMVDRNLVQLTWLNRIAIVYSADDFSPVTRHIYDFEGWGLAHDGERLIVSDGSSTLRFLHPQSFALLGTLQVTDRGVPVDELNELEVIDGELWANVWHSDRIARIDLATGAVNRWLDLSGIIELEPEIEGGEAQNVLNGIAWDEAGRRLFVTGKHWPALFQIELEPGR